MIDIHQERLLTIDEACFKVPNKNRSGRLDYRTIWAWMKKGVRGVKLERTKVGGSVYTSEEALTRFLRRLNGDDGQCNEHGGSDDERPGNDGAAVAGGNFPPGSRPLPVTPAAERRRQEAVNRELVDRFGLKPRDE